MESAGRGMIAVGFIIGIVLLTMFFGDQLEDQRNPNREPRSQVQAGVTEVMLDQNRWGHYLTAGTINNRPVEFLVDTGATDVVVPARLASDLGLTRGRKGRAMTANGQVTIWSTRIARLTVGDIVLHDVDASINPGMGDMEILLGMSALAEVELVQRGDTLTLRQFN
ncbi:MAG: TIGR02281 family clan AA aspartic protease [Gammaproteobacteria bacterium]|nr:TIGR02281 family clan AA aspartic protease [Gammaproteobacteria bacterium]